LASRSRTSLKWTVRADAPRASPAIIGRWRRRTSGSITTAGPPTVWVRSDVASTADSTTGMASSRWTRFDSTTTIGSSSAGNTALRISPELAISDIDPSSAEVDSQTQGKRPLTMNSAYGPSPMPWLRAGRKRTPKTKL